MKIDRSKIKRSTTEVPPDCKALILRIVDCKETHDLTELLKGVQTWTYGKCELYHWIDALDRFDGVLGKATHRADGRWAMACDVSDNDGRELKLCVLQILRFTSLLIEHSFSRTVYNSMDHLTELLYSSDLTLLLENLHLLFMFSKRSNLLTRLPDDKRGLLLEGLYALAESWGGKEAGFGLAACCLKRPLEDYPSTATTVHMEFYRDGGAARNRSESWTVLHIEDVHRMNKSPSRILDECIDIYDVPQDKQLSLLTHLRLAYYFPVWAERVKLVQARLQALSILVYANAIQENIQQLLYSGLMEELVDILELSQDYLTDIKAAALRTLTSIIHLDRAHNFPNIIEATGAGSYHGFLPMMVRNCINSLTSSTPDASHQYPLPLATALFSFLYHLASYELGGEALVNCGMLESLLKVVNWETSDVEYITFVTRAVRVIDLITNMDMQAFQVHNGLTSFINRLEIEVAACRADQPFEIIPEISSACRSQRSGTVAEVDSSREDNSESQMDTGENNTTVLTTADVNNQGNLSGDAASTSTSKDGTVLGINPGSASNFVHNGTTCLPQRAALLKSMLNFLKKVIQDPAFSDSIRHIMEGSLPNSLKHIISNAEYYGASLFLLAIDVVTVYVFQEPSLLHSLQDNGLTDVITEALLLKDVPPTREVISSMPNVFSALCLNSRGLTAFIKCNPFQSLFKVLLSPEYLPAMRRRRTAEPMGDTASNLGNAMDELMRHQPSLKVAATTAIIQLLKHLGCLGGDTTNTCLKSQTKPMVTSLGSNARAGTSEGGSSDEEDDDDEEASTASHSQPTSAAPPIVPVASSRDSAVPVPPLGFTQGGKNVVIAVEEKLPLPLVDYILNVMKCVDAILSNNSTDDHCREFVNQQGLDPLLNILCLRILPIDFPNSPACQAVSSVCKSILNLAHEGLVLDKGLEKLHAVLLRLDVLDKTIDSPGSSVLLKELANSKNPVEAVSNCLETPILHDMTAVHSLIMMFIHVCRTGQSDIRTLSINHWGSKTGLEVLRLLSKLYLNLVWESTVLLALCSGEYQPDADGFGRSDLDKLIPPSGAAGGSSSSTSSSSSASSDINKPLVLSPSSQDSNCNMETQQDLSRSCDGESWDQMDVDSESNMATSSQPGQLVNSSTQTTTKQDKEKNGGANDTLQHYAKLLKPILSASSRLGRALAELFGLLVKLCVGSPLRQRRGHHMPAMQGYVTTTASQVAEVLAQLLNNGLKWQPKPNSPVPRLTFSICAVGFSAPLLFDEKKYPYHLMLRQFMDSDGLSSLFEVFYWAISESSPDTAGPVAVPNEHQVEFLDSWLLLMEKFVNPKLVLESPHSLPLKPPILRNPFNASLFLANVHKKAFDAVMFLWRRYDLKLYGTRAVESMLAILCHILRYREQSKLTGKGKDNQQTQHSSQQAQSRPAATTQSTNDLTTQLDRAGPSVGQLGRSAIGIVSGGSGAPPPPPPSTVSNRGSIEGTAATSAVTTPISLDSSQPISASGNVDTGGASNPISVSDTTRMQRTSSADQAVTEANIARSAGQSTPSAGGSVSAGGTPLSNHMAAAYELGINVDHLRQLMDMGFSVEMCIEALITSNSLHQATDYLLNANSSTASAQQHALATAPAVSAGVTATAAAVTAAVASAAVSVANSASLATAAAAAPTTVTTDPPDQEMLRLFNNLKSEEVAELLKPEELDLFTETIMDQCLKILDTVPETVYKVCEVLVAVGQRNGTAWMKETLTGIVTQIEGGIETISYAIQKDVDVLLSPEFKTESAPVAHRIHLFSLMFEELKGMSAMALEKKHVIDAAIELIRLFHDRCEKSSQKDELKRRTPSWLAPLILMIDLYEKAAVAAKRRLRVSEETDHIWKWFDINSGKWCSYSSPNNSTIDSAFWEGESMVRITAGRRRYVINFTAMIQLNEETSNRRPITLWLKAKPGDGSTVSAAGVAPGAATTTSNTATSTTTTTPATNELHWPLPDSRTFTSTSEGMFVEHLSSAMGEDFDLLWGPHEDAGGAEGTLVVTGAPKNVTKPGEDVSTQGVAEPIGECCKMPRLKGLDMAQKKQIVESTTTLMGWPVNPDTLHAIMRLILRLTRSYEVAEVFSEHSGVKHLTTLTSDSSFSGFFPLANLLIRHVLEDSQSLKYAIEKMIRAKALSSGASTCKELHYLLRVLAPIACRHEDYFVEVAGRILRVDITFVTRRGEEDARLIVKPIPCKLENVDGGVGEQARNAIETLLDALTVPNSREEEEKKGGGEQLQDGATSATTTTTADSSTQKSDAVKEEETMETDAVTSTPSTKPAGKPEKGSSGTNTTPTTAGSEDASSTKKKQLIPKYAICQLLAESVHSYSFPCKIIAEYTFFKNNNPWLQEDCSALAFLLDKMLSTTENSQEKDCSSAVRDLISAMAGCNHIPEAQAIVISEVKAALQRALSMRESPEKHSRIQGLAALICTMIETCPSAPPNQMVPVLKPTTLCMNQVVRLLIRKNVTIDLARIPHSLDLSSPYMATTVNAALKPLEVISRIVNQPVATNPSRPKSKPEQTVQESVNNTHTGGTSNSEMTHAQGEETVEDADNTEHDISAAAESLLDATSESHTHEHDAPEAPDDDVLDEIMDQLLERDTVPSEELIIADSSMMDSSTNRMDTEQESTQRDSRDFVGNQYEEDHDHNDTSESESEASNGEDEGDEEGEEEEDEDEEEEDDEDDDEDGASNFDERGQEEWDDGFMRFTGLDRDEDLLMVQYGQDPENTPVFFTNNATYNLNVGLFDDPMGSEHSSGLRLSHPLLQPPATDQPVTGTVTTRGHRSGRQRRYQYIQFNPRHPHPPAILQRLLGPSTAQEVIQLTTGQALNQGMRDARFLVMDATADQGISRTGAAGSTGCVSNYTALHWWCEEAKALDGESLHDSVVACKRKIVECIEYYRDKAFEMRREMKKKQAEEKQKRSTAEAFKLAPGSKPAAGTTPSAPSVDAVAAEEYRRLERTLERMVDIRTVVEPNHNLITTEQNIVDNMQVTPTPAERQELNPSANTNGPVMSMDNSGIETIVAGAPNPFPPQTTTTVALQPQTSQAEAAAPDGAEGQASKETPMSPSNNALKDSKDDSQNESRAGEEVSSLSAEVNNVISAQTGITSAGAAALLVGISAVGGAVAVEPIAGPSGTQSSVSEDFRNILGDIDIPEGVDPSFLAALPEDMRQEVIAEHLRLQTVRSRPAATVGLPTEPTSMVDVSPEFLAALPPNIQEEVLAQQRIEQQRRIATVSNPNDPMDTEAFFRNLQPSLRQAILADMEESQIAALPADLAAEAQSLRREWESRNRQFIQDRLFSHGHTGTTLSSILRNSGMRLSSRYSIANVAQRAQWSSHWPRAPTTMATHTGMLGGKVKGKQLVDNETLSCLLVLLFVDEPRLNTGRLHRVLRNLCYHSTTRQWVIRSLLSVMERANDCTISTPPGVITTRQKLDHLPSTSTSSSSSKSNTAVIKVVDNAVVEKRHNSHTPAWLNISLDAALGCRANVFLLQKSASASGGGGKKSAIEHRQIFIHPQAVPTICRHTLDVLSNLAKSFPSQFLPSKGRPSLLCLEPSLSRASGIVEKKPPTPPPPTVQDSKNMKGLTSGKGSKSVESMIDFWDHLLKLDSASSSKKGKAIGKAHSGAGSGGIDQGVPAVPFEASPFGQLISMFAYPFIRRSSVLTDKLLRLLSLISLGIPDTSGFGRKVLLEEPEAPVDTTMSISKSHLKLIIDIITTKSCSEEGLEEATSLLLNLSYGPPSTRNKILELLTDGVRDLGNTVCGHIADLQRELQALRKDPSGGGVSVSGSGTIVVSFSSVEDMGVTGGSSNSQQGDHDNEKGFKGQDSGTIVDRFTKEKVIIQSGGKGKAPTELQLPSMATLTSKSSSQAFFLRLLKVIISLRDAIRAAIKKHKQKEQLSTTAGSIGGPLMSSTIVGPSGIGASGAVSNEAGPSGGAAAAAARTPGRQSDRPRGSGEDPGIDGWPMDVDMEPFLYDSMDTSEPRDPARNRRSAASDTVENIGGGSSLPPLVDVDETVEDGDSGAAGRSERRDSSKILAGPGQEVKVDNLSDSVDEAKLLPRLSGLLELDSLWETLSQCLLELGHTPDHHAVLVLQPAVEAFFLVHASSSEREDKKLNVRESREAQLAHLQQDLPPVSPIEPSRAAANVQRDAEMLDTHNSTMLDTTGTPAISLSPDTQKFLTFAETHRTVLNQILRQSTQHLADGPFSVLVDHTRVLDFDVKRRYFRTELERLDEGVRREDLAVHVRRSNVFEDSFRELQRRRAEEWKNRFYIVFEGEEGQDAGGLLREWYVIISREIFNPMYALFTTSPGDRVTYMINPSSHYNSSHLLYFKFVGRVIAKAIYDNKLLECYFTRSFYKHILGKYVKYTDMESEDYSFYQGLVFLMDHHISELGYDLTFSTEVQEFGVTEVRDLIKDGRNIAVTEENKMEYIRLVCQMKMTGAIRKQLNAFLEGFYDIIPKRLISIFNEQELELLISGLPNIDIEDLKANTEYHKYQPNSLQIQWFWRALRSFDQAERAKFLQFVTGTSKVPLQGFGALEGMNGVQKFQIHRDDRSTDRLPSAHTCFNQLDLPAYETYDKLCTYLRKAIHECSEGFGFA